MREYVTNAIQDDYPEDFAWCYGCGRMNDDGNHFRTGWEGDETVTYASPDEKYTAIPGFVYGGYLASLVDCHGSGSCALAMQRKNGHEPGDGSVPPRFVTASLEVTYLKPTPKGKVLKAVGKTTEIHPKKWRVDTEVYAGDELVVTGVMIGAIMPDTFRTK